MHTFSYTTSEATQRLVMRSIFWVTLGRKWIVILAFIVVGPLILFAADRTEWVIIGWGGLVAGILLLLQWTRSYFAFMAAARTQYALLEDPNVTINLTDEFIEIASTSSTGQIRWSKLNRYVITKDALLLYDKKLVVIMIPRAAIPPGMEAEILASIQ